LHDCDVFLSKVYFGEGKKGIDYSKQINKGNFHLHNFLKVPLGTPKDIKDICLYNM